MPEPTALKNKKVAVVLEDGDNCVEYLVQTRTSDSIQWDFTRARNDWPMPDKAPFLWMAFLAWHAMRRTGDTTMTFEQFREAAVDVRHHVDEETVDPTQSGREPDFS